MPPQLGEVLDGTYLLEQLIGQGGMGAVYLARNVRTNEQLAVKCLHASAVNPSSVERLRGELRIAAKLRGPRTVKIFDFQLRGTPYIVMELLKGETLEARLRSAPPLGVIDAANIVLQACAGLATAHAEGIVHRDLKPGNLFLADGLGHNTTIKLLDFGIAIAADEVHDAASMTRTGAILGTPAYSSPEQLSSSRQAGPASDIWSLGVILYELLGGVRPFDGDGVPHLMAAILRDPVVRLRDIRGDVPGGLELAILRCLEKAPERRFANVLAFAEAISPFAGPDAAALLEEVRLSLTGGTQPFRNIPAPTQRDWGLAAEVIPPSLANNASSIVDFLQANFVSCIGARAGIVELADVWIENAIAQQYFVVFMVHDTPSAGPILSTRTFLSYVKPLDLQLVQLDRNNLKVVIVVLDSPELGPGVRNEIWRYRRDFRAIVLPVHVTEIAALSRGTGGDRRERARQMFRERLTDLHSPANPFAARGPITNPLSFYGMKALRNELVAELAGGSRLVAVAGSPGSGKSSLLGMIRSDIPNATFIRVRCAEHRGALALATAVARECSLPVTDLDIRHILVDAHQLALAQANAKQEPLIFLFDDADWALRALVSTEVDSDELRLLRSFWTTVAEMVGNERTRIVVASAFGYLLSQRRLSGWENPCCSLTRQLSVHTIDTDSLRELLEHSGSQSDVTFSPDALDDIVLLSGGHVATARELASQALTVARRSVPPSALVATHITRNAVKSADDVVGSYGAFFASQILPWLDEIDRVVLRVVARRRFRSFNQIATALALDQDDCRTAIEKMRGMGILAWSSAGNERITIPSLEKWAQRSLSASDGEQQKIRGSRVRFAVLGIGSSILLACAYPLVFHKQQAAPKNATLKTDACEYQVDYPSSAEPGTDVSLNVYRRYCKEAETELIELQREPGSTVDFTTQKEKQVASVTLEFCPKRPAVSACPAETVTAKLSNDPPTSTYALSLSTSKSSTAFGIRPDSVSVAAHAMDAVFKLALSVPALAGVVLAFYEQLGKVMKRILSLLTGKTGLSAEGS